MNKKLLFIFILTILFITIILRLNIFESPIVGDDNLIPTEEISFIKVKLEPQAVFLRLENKSDINELIKMINGLKYKKKLSIQQAVKQYHIGPGAEYAMTFFDKNNQSIGGIEYYMSRKILSIADTVYILKEDIHKEIDKFLKY